MLTIEIQGGLGNQLFQIFTLIATSLDSKIPFFFRYVERPVRTDRPFYWDSLFSRLAMFIKKDISFQYVYKEPHFHYEAIPWKALPNSNEENVALAGYFQSHKYFDHHKKSIIKLLKLKDKKEEVLKRFCDLTGMDESFFDECVSLHFRIGDYVNVQHVHPVLDLEYYKNSLDRLVQDTNRCDWKILYFYEKQDQELVDKNIKILKRKFKGLEFVGIDHRMCDWEQMLAMTLCQHNIIANSTFSWWGAYLNEHEDCIVYYPELWFNKNCDKNVSDLCLTLWTRVQS